MAHSEALYKIEGSIKLPYQSGAKLSSARVLLNRGEYTAIVRLDGSFAINDVPAGSYSLDVTMVEYLFAPIRLDVSGREDGSAQVKATVAGRREKVSYPLILKPQRKAEYFQQRVPMDVFSLLRNPTVIMVLVMGMTVFVFPKLMNNMDPKEMEELRKMQGQMSLTNILKGNLPQPSQ